MSINKEPRKRKPISKKDAKVGKSQFDDAESSNFSDQNMLSFTKRKKRKMESKTSKKNCDPWFKNIPLNLYDSHIRFLKHYFKDEEKRKKLREKNISLEYFLE